MKRGFLGEKHRTRLSEAVEVSVFVPWGALSVLPTRSTHKDFCAWIKSFNFKIQKGFDQK